MADHLQNIATSKQDEAHTLARASEEAIAAASEIVDKIRRIKNLAQSEEELARLQAQEAEMAERLHELRTTIRAVCGAPASVH